MPTSGSSSSSRIDRAEGSGTPCIFAMMRSLRASGVFESGQGDLPERRIRRGFEA